MEQMFAHLSQKRRDKNSVISAAGGYFDIFSLMSHFFAPMSHGREMS
jgi:hypothetical protein